MSTPARPACASFRPKCLLDNLLRTLTLAEIRSRRRRTRSLRKVHNHVVPQYRVLRHDIKVVVISVLIGATTIPPTAKHTLAAGHCTHHPTTLDKKGLDSPRSTPIRVAARRAQVRHHHQDTLPRGAARALPVGRRPRRRERVALPAAGAAPCGVAEERSVAGRGVEAGAAGLGWELVDGGEHGRTVFDRRRRRRRGGGVCVPATRTSGCRFRSRKRLSCRRSIAEVGVSMGCSVIRRSGWWEREGGLQWW